MVVWSGKRVAQYVEDVTEDMIQPNGIDLKVNSVFQVEPDGERRQIKPDKYLTIYLKARKPYILNFKNKVVIPDKVVGMFFVRSTMWRTRGILIQPSLWDTGYIGHGEVLVYPTIDTYLRADERFGQIVFLDADDTFVYSGQYQEG